MENKYKIEDLDMMSRTSMKHASFEIRLMLFRSVISAIKKEAKKDGGISGNTLSWCYKCTTDLISDLEGIRDLVVKHMKLKKENKHE